MINLILSLSLAYLVGSIPTAYLAVKFLKGIDIRNFGSGNVGATNAYRLIGKVPGISVLLIDILKGYLPIVLLPNIFILEIGFITPEIYQICVGACAISGHVWPIFLKFEGGKGVATTAGVLLGIAPKILLAAFGIWLLFLIVFRYVSVASIATSISLPILSLALNKQFSTVLFFIIIAFMGTYKHRSNIKRLIRGEEKKIF